MSDLEPLESLLVLGYELVLVLAWVLEWALGLEFEVLLYTQYYLVPESLVPRFHSQL